MKILIVGGSFGETQGRPSSLVNQVIEVCSEAECIEVLDSINGGTTAELVNAVEKCVDYDAVFWWANVSNDLPKVRNIKATAPYTLLVSSKRNDDSKYSFQELVNHVLALKANLTFEFKKNDQGLFNMMVFDPLGSCWYNGADIKKAVLATLDRLQFLLSITRQKTYQAEEGVGLVLSWYFDRFKENMHPDDSDVNIPDERRFVEIVRGYAEVFQDILKPAKEVTRFLGNASMRAPQVGRCGKGMPSFRHGDYIFVSQRNIDKQFIELENFVPTYLKDGKVYYCGNKKPSVDTPIQLRLYERMPKINYMIHSHCYIKGAPFTTKCIPCGAVEEADEVCMTLKRKYGMLELSMYTINLIGHGSIVFAQSLDQLQNIQYYGRTLPESMFNS